MRINKVKAGLIIIFSLLFVPLKTVKGAIPKDPIAKWQLIRDDFFIDTNDFEIENEKINFWVKIGKYEKTRLIIDCKNLRYRETFLVSKGLLKRNAWQPVIRDSAQFEISNQLCFLSKVEGFKPERNDFKLPSWVKRIKFVHEKNINEAKLLNTKNELIDKIDKKEFKFVEE